MSKPETLSRRRLAAVVIGAQALTALILPLIVWGAVGKEAGLATAAGGSIAAIANGYFALRAFQYSGARASPLILKSMYRGEAGKLIIVIVLMIATFHWWPTARDFATYLFSAFFVVYCCGLLVPFFARH